MICVAAVPTGTQLGTSGSLSAYATTAAYPMVTVVPCTSAGAYALMTVEEATGQDLAALGITSDAVLQAFGWGFAAVLLFWSLGYAVGVAKAAIRKA